MTKYNGCTSESKKCAFCNKVTSDYMSYEVKGIEIRIHSHYACRKDLSDTAKICFSILKKEAEEIKINCQTCQYWRYENNKALIETCNFGNIEHSYRADSFMCNNYKPKILKETK